jgi:hypothetical protein
VNNEWKIIQEEAVVAWLRQYPRNRSEGPGEITKESSIGAVHVPVEIQSEYVPNTNLERYRYTSQLNINTLDGSGYYI